MTHRTQFLRRQGLDTKESYSLAEISKMSGVKKSDLQEVYNRGSGAWRTNINSVRMKGTFKKNVVAPRSAKLSREQWSMARVWAFLNKLERIKEGKQKYMNQDQDIFRKYYTFHGEAKK